MTRWRIPEITLWRVIVGLIFAAGAWATYLRFAKGFQVATNLSNAQPWGIWVGLATLCGVGLSAGGFTIAGAVYLLGMERYRPVARAAVVIAFLGYLSVVLGYAWELGLPWNFWHPLVMWNRASVLFEVVWCIVLYTTVLALEFSPAVVEKLPWKGVRERFLHWHHRVLIALVLVGVLLSSLHQSYLGGLFIIFKGKMYPLWYSNYQTTLFYMSAIPAGIAMVIMALYLSVRSLNVRIDMRILDDFSRIVAPMLVVFTLFRFADLAKQHALGYLFKPVIETAYFWGEMLLFVAVPLVLFNLPQVRRSPIGLYWASAVTIAGFVMHRLDVSITSLERATQAGYVPKWPELAVTMMLVTAAVLAFRWSVLHLKILPRTLEVPAPTFQLPRTTAYVFPAHPGAAVN
ncbi:MAG TPA: NrfD/PsrC family molybdoenzyme membrane anchor subunit [Terriglobales bacterium]|jgi:Ni/Fe-hydrogenase subunit HybB-like protein|nr:NrfD/PsrC family molybdoenzyme membrane anchor subunit [Terriglobales bacterium]